MSNLNVDKLLPLDAVVPPLRVDSDGVVRVGDSRVPFDIIVEQYENGMAPEDMVRAYDALDLADVHDAIAYYLRHHEEVWQYLKQRKEQAAALRATVEARHPPILRGELLDRQNAGIEADASTGQ